MADSMIVLATNDLSEQVELEQVLGGRYDVLAVDDADAFISVVEQRLPDVILVAADFGGQNGGLILCRHLKASPRVRNIPIVMICNRRIEFELDVGGLGEPNEILLRPIHFGELHVRIETVLRLQEYASRMVEGSRVDPLTSAYTRSYLLERLSYEVRRANRYGRSLAIAMVELDGFSELVSAQGVDIGDRILSEVSRVVSSQVRGVDLLARSGDEEFSIIFPETSLLVVRPIGERLCAAIRNMVCVFTESPPLQISASIGLAGLPHPEIQEIPELMRCARAALATARGEGGDKPILY